MIIQGEEVLGLVRAICLLFQPGRAEAESFTLHFNMRNAWIRVLGCCDVVTKPGAGAAVMKGGCLKHWVMTGAHLSALCRQILNGFGQGEKCQLRTQHSFRMGGGAV